jgi:hypothetical protein
MHKAIARYRLSDLRHAILMLIMQQREIIRWMLSLSIDGTMTMGLAVRLPSSNPAIRTTISGLGEYQHACGLLRLMQWSNETVILTYESRTAEAEL